MHSQHQNELTVDTPKNVPGQSSQKKHTETLIQALNYHCIQFKVYSDELFIYN